MGDDGHAVEDPFLRAAVLDLFRASQDLHHAYQDVTRSQGRDRHALEALAAAEARVDSARERVTSVQSTVWPR